MLRGVCCSLSTREHPSAETQESSTRDCAKRAHNGASSQFESLALSALNLRQLLVAEQLALLKARPQQRLPKGRAESLEPAGA